MTVSILETLLFPSISPHRSGRMVVDSLHELYWEECGNPAGIPVLFLHGGPGGGIAPNHRRFFDPAAYRIILFDQRGAGQSTPLGEYRNNTTQLLVEDIEKLRAMLEVSQWLIFGGSWGSTLALAYGQAHPSACLGFILRGIFLGSRAEIDWFVNGIKWFYPDAHQRFAEFIPAAERHDLIEAYRRRLFSDDPAIYLPAARSWTQYESQCLFLLPQGGSEVGANIDRVSLSLGRLEAHYMLHQCFLADDQLLSGVAQIRHLPATIVQGRYDVVCPPLSAFRLYTAWPEAQWQLIADAGHAALEPGIAAALVAATEVFKRQRHFG